MLKLKKKIKTALASILPTHCHNCSQLMPITQNSTFYCEKCLQELLKIIEPVEIYRKELNGSCAQFFSLIDYHKVKDNINFIQDIKTHNKSFLLKELLSRLFSYSFIPKPDEVLYIPVSFRKYLERGFNPSFIIAKHLSEYFKVPLRKVFSKKDTLSQSRKNRKDRLNTMENSVFKLKKIPQHKKPITRVLIVDDIITTGATLSNAAKVASIFYHKNAEIIGFGLFHSER